MNTIDKIRAEIERQMKYYDEKERKAWDDLEHGDEDALWYQGHRKMCAKLLSFLDTLEPVSEDERIRKWLIELVENQEPKVFIEVRKMDVFAYLEKQKEQKPSNAYQLWFGNEMKDQKPADKLFEEWIDGWFKEHKEKAYPQITMDEKEFKNFCRGIRNMYWQNPFAIHIDNSNVIVKEDEK